MAEFSECNSQIIFMFSIGKLFSYLQTLRLMIHSLKKIGSDTHFVKSHPTPYARSFRRRFFAYHYAVNHPHTNIILS